MAALLDSLRASFEGSIDFEGQRKAEKYTNTILPASAILAFIVGLVLQDLRITLGIYGMGFVSALLIVVPPWNMYRQNPISWLAVQPEESTEVSRIEIDSKKKR